MTSPLVGIRAGQIRRQIIIEHATAGIRAEIHIFPANARISKSLSLVGCITRLESTRRSFILLVVFHFQVIIFHIETDFHFSGDIPSLQRSDGSRK